MILAKQHRYVSECGPHAPPAQDRGIARALAVAENEGWPAAATQRNATASSAQRAFERSAREVLFAR
jgi:hypothetical protein